VDVFWDDSARSVAVDHGSSPFDLPGDAAVLDATLDWPQYSRRFTELFTDIDLFKVMHQEYPSAPDVVVISGSTSGVYEDAEWIDVLVERTREFIAGGVPVLGLCFGHQIIGQALGADVVQMDRYEIGYNGIQVDDVPLFDGMAAVEYPFSTHQDRVVDLPAVLEPIARTDMCVQGFQHREKPVYGVQFHPELTPPIAERA